ncbi:hypothetical protein [Sphingomicrobium sediminis]|uniref:Uncharacterized protein n=1 Tax=Sphingomicrobium sediminis TaxID=2950949 RepID=A0A9X2J4Q6_9SPHN|nr:hypothetical protein [Sphingomicrobium sediminis]MCM8557472.1 hypothetical protein [Sphingomicrobium sediminis]
MAVFRCLVLGENFPLIEDGEKRLKGFYVTRWTEAEDEGEAEQDVLAKLRTDELLASLKDLRDGSDPEARITFEEIDEVERFPDEQGGFAWFPMESANKSESECNHENQRTQRQ